MSYPTHQTCSGMLAALLPCPMTSQSNAAMNSFLPLRGASFSGSWVMSKGPTAMLTATVVPPSECRGQLKLRLSVGSRVLLDTESPSACTGLVVKLLRLPSTTSTSDPGGAHTSCWVLLIARQQVQATGTDLNDGCNRKISLASCSLVAAKGSAPDHHHHLMYLLQIMCDTCSTPEHHYNMYRRLKHATQHEMCAYAFNYGMHVPYRHML